MPSDICPNPDVLHKFVRCSITEQEADDVLRHLEQCPACEETVIGLERDGDTLVDLLRKAAAVPTFADEPECRRLIESLRELDFSLSVAPLPASDLAVNQTVRDYQILSKIGQGGMGAVYKALHRRLQRTVALKVLPTHSLYDAPAVARFEREMSVLGQLNHPHIVQALDAGEQDGQHYLVMEFVEGLDLGEIVRRHGRLPIADACLLISQAALGLQYAHEHGFVHRDIKPSNLMLSPSRDRTGATQAIVKILDLGLARALDQPAGSTAAQTDLTSTGQLMGTFEYMAPEQGGDAHDVDIRADIYALGATLYKLLTGKSPFAEHAHKPLVQRLMAIAREEPPAIRTKRPEVPERLAAVVQRMLAKDPADRWATPAAVVEALAPFCDGADLAQLLAPPAPAERHDPLAPTMPVASTGAGDRASRGRRRGTLAVCGALLLAAAVLVVVTRQGTVEISTPDGQLPDDVKIVVSQAGEEVALLQVDNEWSARIVNGEYQVQLRGGDDRFEIKNSQLIVNRMGQAVVTVTLKPQATAPRPDTPATVQKTSPPTEPPVAPVVVDRNDPFVVVRAGSDTRSFKTLGGAIEELAAGDLIEIRTNDRLPISLTEIVNQPLHLRAGAGFRPTLVFIGGPRVDSINANVAFIDANLTCEGIDFDVRRSAMLSNPSAAARWRFTGCRWWGPLPFGQVYVAMTDCILDASDGFGVWTGDSEVELDNCAVRHAGVALSRPAGGGHHRFVIRNCTYVAVDFGAPLFARIEDHSTLAVEASGNLFHSLSQAVNPVQAPSLQQVQWTGVNNCYSGTWYRAYEQQPDQTYTIKEQGISGWNKLWDKPETESRDVAGVVFELGRSQQTSMVEALPVIREQVHSRIAAHRHTSGPDWDLVGAGEEYLRDLAVRGAAIAADALRPERLDGGPFIVVRKGAAVAGHPSLQDAIDAAHDGDVVEIRTDRVTAGARLAGENRLLTIRSGPGYAPVVDGTLFSESDRLILEGVIVQQQISAVAPGAIVALRNCVAEGTDPPFSVGANGETVPEIVNCAFHNLQLKLNGSDAVRIRNSVVGGIVIAGTNTETLRPRIEIEQSLCFAPMPTDRGDVCSIRLDQGRPIEIRANRSIFVSPRHLVHNSHDGLSWSGAGNVFAKAFEFFGFNSTLSDFQSRLKTELDSVELAPWEFDPAQWHVVRDRSPGYEPQQDDRDYGADVDRLIKSIKDVVHPAIPNAPSGDATKDAVIAERVLPPVAPAPKTILPDRERPFVTVDHSGKVLGEYRFISEVLPLLKSEDIVEVRGNGPFKIPQVVRNNQALHIRAGQGYRPTFVPGFAVNDEELFVWFQVNDSPLTVEGCDFVGATAYNFVQFNGTGDTWTFLNCRFLQSYTSIGNLITFNGKRLVIRDSLLANNSQYYTIGFGPPVHVEFENNIVYRGPHALFACAAQDGFEFALKRNLFFAGQSLFNLGEGATGRVKVHAEGNVFHAMHSVVVTGEATEPRNRLDWTGSGNTFVPMAQTTLWDNRTEGAAQEHRIAAAADWNAYWGNDDDLRVVESAPFPFELLETTDWNQAWKGIEAELSASRQRSPSLPNLGPDIKQVGVGEAYWSASLPNESVSPDKLEPALEGGPFVIVRDGKATGGFVTLEAAILSAQNGDIIEIRSDGTFPATGVIGPPETHLTLRAARGYRPCLIDFVCGAGDWTLEGLRIRHPDGPPQAQGFVWSARRVINCVVEGGKSAREIIILSPPGFSEAVVLRNCLFCENVQVRTSNVQVENCILPHIELQADEEGTLECRRCCFWTRNATERSQSIAMQGAGPHNIHVSDTLLESDYILSADKVTWRGERNLYRTHSGLWGTFAMPEGRPEAWRRTLDEWRAVWNSDTDSQFEESALLHPKMWRRH